MAFLQLQEQVDQATLMARRTVSSECIRSTEARPKVAIREVPLRESLEFGMPQSGAMATLPMAEGDVLEPRRSSRFKLSFADELVDEEPEDPTESSVDEEPEEPLVLPAATSSGRDNLGLPHGEPDPYLLHAQHESLEKIKREWQEAREALLEEHLQQRIRFQEELEREKEALYLQLQQDREKQKELRLFAKVQT
uniref:Uncharacterized protein n=1 Tax=Sphaerodactylus townsendi TaxID=933632 RepID=A0ACB8ECY7_9SAUR